jgi:DNA-binding response OmpR family regulator
MPRLAVRAATLGPVMGGGPLRFAGHTATAFALVRLLYARAPVRVVLIETAARELPFVGELLAFDDAVVLRCDESEVGSVAAAAADLLVVGRDDWSDEDTELCRRLHAARLAVPLLAVSGPCDTQRRASALRAGADEFLSIPFEVDELVARAFALVRRASSGSRRAHAGVFTVDFARRQIFAGGRPVVLTLREYDLLTMLIERSGEVVTRRELAGSAVSGSESESNVVDVHMSRIREKLGKCAAQIQTVRGLGYRLRRS